MFHYNFIRSCSYDMACHSIMLYVNNGMGGGKNLRELVRVCQTIGEFL